MGKPTAGLEVHIGPEVTWGTRVPPTVKLMGVTEVTLTPTHEIEQLSDELRGTLAQSYESVVQKKGAEGTIGGMLMYEDAPYILSNVFRDLDTDMPASNGLATDASGGTWSFTGPLESSDIADPRYNTVVYGDGTHIWSLAGGTGTSLSISFNAGEPVTYEWTMFGKSLATDTFGSATDRDADVATAPHGQIWIDAATDAPGTSSDISNLTFSGELTINTNRAPIYHVGDLEPSGSQDMKWDAELSLVLEIDALTEPHMVDAIGATTEGIEKNVRVKFLSDSDYVQFDFGGVIAEPPEFYEDNDGVITYSLNLAGQVTEGMPNMVAAQCKTQANALS